VGRSARLTARHAMRSAPSVTVATMTSVRMPDIVWDATEP
jgi:hypothetical protein